jgi:plasmid maintenance system antidote protein VapI
MSKRRKPLYAGEVLREQFMPEFGLSVNRLARAGSAAIHRDVRPLQAA